MVTGGVGGSELKLGCEKEEECKLKQGIEEMVVVVGQLQGDRKGKQQFLHYSFRMNFVVTMCIYMFLTNKTAGFYTSHSGMF